MPREESNATPHDCSFAVWDIPGPTIAGDVFTPTLGINCSSGCNLAGKHVQVLGQDGCVAGEATLSHEPWPGTQALYTARIPLSAPSVPGKCQWTFRIVPSTPDDTPHSITGAAIETTICARPEHAVTIVVSDAATHLPIGSVNVRFGPYRGITNQRGIAAVGAARGAYLLDAWKSGYADCNGGVVKVEGDVEIALEISSIVENSPDDERVWM